MFSDFDSKTQGEGGGGRRTVSFVLASVIFVAVAIAIGAAIATARAVVHRREREVDVEFAELEQQAAPEPEREPTPPSLAPAPRAPHPRPAALLDAPPRSIPNERPAEMDGELSDTLDVGPGGSEDGVEGGTGEGHEPPPPVPLPLPAEPPPGPAQPPPRPPQQERIEVAPARMLSGCQRPERPATLEGATAETITMYVRLVVGPDGRVLRARLEATHPLVPEETLLACVRTRVFEPAHLPDGTPVPYPLRYAFTFRPDVL